MTKKSKKIIVISALSALVAPAVVGGVMQVVSCSSNNDDSKAPDLSTLEANANKKFVDIPNHTDAMTTPDVVKKILLDTNGKNLVLDQLANTMIFNWYYRINPELSSVQDTFKTKIEQAEKNYKDAIKGKTNFEIQSQFLDPNGGTAPSYIYKQVVEDFKSDFTNMLFQNNYLCLQDTPTTFKPIEQSSSLSIDTIMKPEYVNGDGGVGNRNKFVFNASKYESGSENNIALQKGLADFINYIFMSYVKDNMPILTPSILFKNEANPDTSGLFNKDFFSEVPAEGSYKFQYFKPSSNDMTAMNASTRYKMFLDGLKQPTPGTTGAATANSNHFVDSSLNGLINIEKRLTEDSTTFLITNLSDAFDNYVAPYSSIIDYKFTKTFDNTLNDVTVGDFDPNSIMGNFLTTTANAPGYFSFPYPTTDGKISAYGGDYANITGIRDAVDIGNDSPFMIIRNEFGVHIIGIDRYAAIKQAAGGTLNAQNMNKVINELANTILFRQAEDQLLGTTQVDLMSKLKTYFESNFSQLVISYALQASPSADNLFKNSLIFDASITPSAQISQQLNTLALAAIDLKQAEKVEKFKATVKGKIYDLQKTYNDNSNESNWKNNALAGVLPYQRNTATGDFDSLIKLTTLSNFADVKQKYLDAVNAYMPSVQPGDSSYFSGDNKLKYTSRYVYTNSFVLNLVLCQDTITTVEKGVFDRIVDDINLEVGPKDQANNPTFFDFNTNTVNNAAADNTLATLPTVSDGSTPAGYQALNQWINGYINRAIQQDVIPNFQLKTTSAINQYANGDWTTANFLANMQTQYKNAQTDATYVGGDFLSEDVNTELRKTINALFWLLDYDVTTGTYSFNNFIKILREPLQNNYYKVGYLGWTNESNIIADSIAKTATPSYQYGVTGKADAATISAQQAKDTAFKNNALLINNINSYSYQGATNPYANLASWATECYFGKNDTYYSMAKLSKTSTADATGFLGFQLPSSSYVSMVLPSDLYASNQELLTQNISNPDQNFKGFFYKYNTDGTVATAKTNFKNEINTYSNGEIENLCAILLNQKFNFTEDQLTQLRYVQSGIDYSMTQTGNASLTTEERRTRLSNLIDSLPDNVYEQKLGEYLWTSQQNTFSTTVFSSDDSVDTKQYLVSQFNLADVDALVTKVGDAGNQYLDPTKLLGLNPETFFKALVKLASSPEVLSRAETKNNDFWSETDNQVTLFNKPLFGSIDEAWIKNKKAFEK